jgi:hypothetical protein
MARHADGASGSAGGQPGEQAVDAGDGVLSLRSLRVRDVTGEREGEEDDTKAHGPIR